jgi:hypothetical protein
MVYSAKRASLRRRESIISTVSGTTVKRRMIHNWVISDCENVSPKVGVEK